MFEPKENLVEGQPIPFQYSTSLLWQSPSKKIGKTWWKYVVYEKDGSKFTSYLYWDIYNWKSMVDHPKYNGDDTYAGLPKSTTKLYYENESTIKSFLGDIE